MLAKSLCANSAMCSKVLGDMLWSVQALGHLMTWPKSDEVQPWCLRARPNFVQVATQTYGDL